MGAGTVARFSWNDTLLLSEWIPGWGLLDLPPSQDGTSTLWASQKEEDWGLVFLACYFWNRVCPLNRCWWKEGTQTSGLDWPGTEFLHLRSGGEEHCWQLAALQEKLGDPGVLDHIPMG